MAFDGTTLASVVHELSETIIGGRVDKISQPEPDEIILNIRGGGMNHKLLITANSSAPRIGFTKQSKISPLKAPMFCMVLRKHLSGGRIIEVSQPDFERIVEIHIDAMDEMGDRGIKILLVEIMGKHSNIMILDNNRRVLDAIKHISPAVSSVRPILPGAIYSRPPGKVNPLAVSDLREFIGDLTKETNETEKPKSSPEVQKVLYQRYSGISPVLASEICIRAQVSPDLLAEELPEGDFQRLYDSFSDVMAQVSNGHFSHNIYYDATDKAVDLAVLPMGIYEIHRAEPYESPSAMLETFYTRRDEAYRISQKTVDLRKLITTHLERCRKKSFMFEKTLNEIENRDDLRIKGELLTAYLHMVAPGVETFTADNYYDNSKMEIPIDPQLTPSENAQRYYKKYNKQKRTFDALQGQISSNDEDIMYLTSVLVAMETITDEADISEIRAELAEQGFAKAKHRDSKNKKASPKAKPLKFTSSDGFDMYVGKNNTQNDYLTLRFANSSDIWMHTKDIAGSHVIIATAGKTPPESTILEAANLAAFHSRARNSSQVPVDYAEKKHVRKPSGAKPGFVIYDHHKTLYVTPTEPKIMEINF